MSDSGVRRAPLGSVTTRALRGSAVGLLNVALSMGFAALTVPVVLHFWSQETYAVWIAVFTVYTLLQTFDTGHTAFLSNELQRIARADDMAYRRTFASGMLMAGVIGASQMLLVLGMLLVGAVPHVLGMSMSATEVAEAGLALVALSIGWLASGSFGGVIFGLYFSHGDYVRSQWWTIFNRVLAFGGLVVPAVAGGSVRAAGIASALGNVVFALLLIADAWKRYPVARGWRDVASWRTAFANARLSVVVTVNTGLVQLGTIGLSLAVAYLLGGAALPVFTTVRTLTNTAASVNSVAISAILPDMIRYRVAGEWHKLRTSFEACWIGVGFVVHLGLVMSFPVVSFLYAKWTLGQIPFDARLYAGLAWTIGVGVAGTAVLRFLSVLNRLEQQTWCNLTYLAVLAVLVPVAAYTVGLWGVGLAAAVAEIIRTGVVVRALRAELPADEAPHLLRAIRASTVHAIISGTALLLGVLVPAHRTLACAAGSATLALVAIGQWRTLDPELRQRVKAMLGRRARRP